MEACGVGTANFDEGVFGLVLVDLSGDEVSGLPLLNGRLRSHVRNVVRDLREGGGVNRTHLI